MGEAVELHPIPARHTVTILSRRRWYRADVSVSTATHDSAVAVRPGDILVEIMRRMGTGHRRAKPDWEDEPLLGPAPYKILSRGAVDDYPYHVVLDRAQELVNNLEYHEFHGSGSTHDSAVE